MTVRAYYNENNRHAAAWLRNLIGGGQIAPGDVDERDIRAVQPADLRGYTQHHFFAGIGGWSYSLRLAGWPDSRPVWTGSCPCQPFSDAGRGGGFGDDRHVWPNWHDLIRQCLPATIFGEQVASQRGLAWLDAVSDDLEAASYTIGAADLCAAGVGAPHARQRLYFVANRDDAGQQPSGGRDQKERHDAWRGGSVGWLGDAGKPGLSTRQCPAILPAGWGDAGRATQQSGGTLGSLDHTLSVGRSAGGQRDNAGNDGQQLGAVGADDRPGTVDDPWSFADWLHCRDGRWRPVEPGALPLVDGVSYRVDGGGANAGKSRAGLIQGYGNAIVPQVAAAFVRAYIEVRDGG